MNGNGSGAAPPLRLKTVPARLGAQWVRMGFRVFFRRPLAFTALFASFLFAAMLCALLSLAGIALLLATMPLLTLGFMLATRAVLQDKSPTPALFLVPLRADASRRKAMLLLGLVYAGATMTVLLLSDWVDGGALERLQTAMLDTKSDPAAAEALAVEPQLLWGMLLRLGGTALLSLPFWHAPALAWWGGQSASHALFSSTLACWRARGAFCVYGLTWAGLMMLFSALLALLFSLLGSREMIGAAALPAGLMFSTVFYASLYFTFVDSFDQAPPPPDGA